MIAQKTYKEIIAFEQVATQLFNRSARGEKETPLGENEAVPFAQLNRLIKKVTKSLEGYNEAVEDINLKYCLRDEKQVKILGGDKKDQYLFTAENEVKHKADIKKLLDEKVDTHYNAILSYPELLSVMKPAHRHFVQWEDVEEYLAPYYENK